MADQQPKFNPGAYNFVPGGGNFVPRGQQDPNQPPHQGQPAAQPGQPYNNPYNPYAAGQQGAAAYGGYGGANYGGYAGGGYGGYQAGYNGQQGGYAGGYDAQGGYAAPGGYSAYQQGGAPAPGGAPYQPQQARAQPAPATRTLGSNSTFTPPAGSSFVPSSTSSGPSKSISLNIGGAPKLTTPSTGPAKTMSISIGGVKASDAPAKVLSLGKGGKTTLSEHNSAGSSGAASRATTPAPEKKEETSTKAETPTTVVKPSPAKIDKVASEAQDWDEPESTATTTSAVATAPPTSTATPAPTPASGSATPESVVAAPAGKTNFSRVSAKNDADAIAKEAARLADEDTLQELYGGEEVDPNIKHHLNLVFIGHVDAGKSTMGGQLLVLCGMVDKRTLEKLEKEAKDAGRESWYLSWALDSTPQERSKGKTVEVGRAYFETDARRYTILDAPGHKTYVPSMISGAAQADVAVLVISARKGEFETGFERGGQTREHAMLVKNNGVSKLIVVVNKMDDPTVNWAKERFDEVCSKITPYLKQVGFNPKTDITFIPVSAYTGQNMKVRVDKSIASWSEGPSLLEFLDAMPVTDRKVNAPFMMPVSEKYAEMGAIVVGKIESGRVKSGDKLLLMPNKVEVVVTDIFDEQGEDLKQALCGDNVRIRLRGVSDENVSPGFVLTSIARPIKVVKQFRADLAILDTKNIITAGYTCVMHLHTLAEEVTLTALLHYYDKKTGRKSKRPPQFAKKGMRVVAVLETTAPVCIETYKDYPMLGRFSLRDEGKTVAIGKVTRLNQQTEADLAAMENLKVSGGDAGAAA